MDYYYSRLPDTLYHELLEMLNAVVNYLGTHRKLPKIFMGSCFYVMKLSLPHQTHFQQLRVI